MKINTLENGVVVVRDMTPEEEAFYTQRQNISYEDRVVNRIRERYNINQELAILRQRDVKFEEWMEYNNYVEQVKAEEKAREEVINNG